MTQREAVVGRVDVHTHAIDPLLPDLARDYPYDRWPSVQRTGDDRAAIFVGSRHFRDIDAACWSVERRLADMDDEGVAMQVLSPVPVTFCHHAPPAGAAVLARAQNNFLASMVAQAPDRFAALGAVPLQDVPEAVKELRRCREDLGMLGVEIGTVVGELELADPSFHAFFDAAAESGALVFVHPDELPAGRRQRPHELSFGLGMPEETAFAAAALIMSGAFDRWPNLRLCLAHGGGTLPLLLPRMDRGWQMSREAERRCDLPPGEYATRLYCDSLTYDSASLRLCGERFGASHVLLGTDYPFLAGERPAGAVVRRDGHGLPDELVAAVEGESAAALLSRLTGSHA